MPLTERDINAQHEVPRSKRLSSQPESAFLRLKDENSPSLRGASNKFTQPSKHLLAPTKAFAAKIVNSTHETGHITPQSHSKLPRRAATPNTGPPVSKWNLRIAERVASTEKAAMVGGELAMRRADSASINPRRTVSRAPPDRSHINLPSLITTFYRKAPRQEQISLYQQRKHCLRDQ